MTAQMRRAVLKLAGEYTAVAGPILIYVCLETIHNADAAFLYRSPEWSIATVFLIIQTIRMYIEEMHDTAGRLFSYLLVLFLAAITVAAGVNIYIGLGDVQKQAMMTVVVKWALFVVASVVFVYVAGAAIYSAEQTVA